MANLNVKKGDNVMIIAGKDKGKAGEILKVNTDKGRVVVEGTNMISKHVKPRKAQEKGGIIKREGTIDSSNVMIICPNCNEVVRIGHGVEGEGENQKKIRVCKKCGASLDVKTTSAKKAQKKVEKKVATKAKATKATKAKKEE